VVERAARALRARCPGLEASFADGYFGDEEAPERARRVAASGAAVLLAGMGVPRQELFIERYWRELGVTLALGVGGSFEVIAGTRRRAPRFLQVAGLEWLFRLAQEPRRLWRRYLVTNVQFCARMAGELRRERRRRRSPEPGT
jgi:N-acetylglucosaminyldiphosphoundecaprenol N-acetyl-beta-D-mannosaminyltransferase